jgi:sterol carrier protein 2
MEAVGLCGKGEGGKLVDSGRWIRNAAGGELFQVRTMTSRNSRVAPPNTNPRRVVDDVTWRVAPLGTGQVGGRWVVNPSGGLESKGHPIGATGLAQCAELCWQVRTSPFPHTMYVRLYVCI